MKTTAERSMWWQERRDLEDQLKNLLDKVERQWLGGWKVQTVGRCAWAGGTHRLTVTTTVVPNPLVAPQGLLLPHVVTASTSDVAAAELRTALVRAVLPLAAAAALRSRIEELLSLELCHVLLRAGPDPSDDDLEDMLSVVRSTCAAAGVATSEPTDAAWDAVRRVLAARRGSRAPPAVGVTNGGRPHTLLVLDRDLHALPWESLPCMRGVPTTRLPSLALLQARLQRWATDPAYGAIGDRRSVYYVLNPGDDLASTQARLEPIFQAYVCGLCRTCVFTRSGFNARVCTLIRSGTWYM